MRSNIVITTRSEERFECKCCGACCKSRDVPLTLDDIFRLSDFLNMYPDDFFKDYCVEVANEGDKVALPFLKRDGDKCCFLEDNLCQVHFVKPSVCEHMPSTMFGSLEYLRTKMPDSCAIHEVRPCYADDSHKRKSYVAAMMLTTIYYSKYGKFDYVTAKPFIYRILLFKKNRDKLYRFIGSPAAGN